MGSPRRFIAVSKPRRRRRERALIEAVLQDNAPAVRELLGAGADVNTRDARENNETLLILAVQFASVEMVRLLLEAGADVHARDERGRTALLCAPVLSPSFGLLLEHGADLHARDIDGCNRLLLLVPWAPPPEEVRELIRHGLDLNTRDDGGTTPLSIARDLGFVELARLLEAAGASE